MSQALLCADQSGDEVNLKSREEERINEINEKALNPCVLGSFKIDY